MAPLKRGFELVTDEILDYDFANDHLEVSLIDNICSPSSSKKLKFGNVISPKLSSAIHSTISPSSGSLNSDLSTYLDFNSDYDAVVPSANDLVSNKAEAWLSGSIPGSPSATFHELPTDSDSDIDIKPSLFDLDGELSDSGKCDIGSDHDFTTGSISDDFCDLDVPLLEEDIHDGSVASSLLLGVMDLSTPIDAAALNATLNVSPNRSLTSPSATKANIAKSNPITVTIPVSTLQLKKEPLALSITTTSMTKKVTTQYSGSSVTGFTSSMTEESKSISSRWAHNSTERKRRCEIRRLFSGLRDLFPDLHGDDRTSNINTLNRAISCVAELTRKQAEQEQSLRMLRERNTMLKARKLKNHRNYSLVSTAGTSTPLKNNAHRSISTSSMSLISNVVKSGLIAPKPLSSAPLSSPVTYKPSSMMTSSSSLPIRMPMTIPTSLSTLSSQTTRQVVIPPLAKPPSLSTSLSSTPTLARTTTSLINTTTPIRTTYVKPTTTMPNLTKPVPLRTTIVPTTQSKMMTVTTSAKLPMTVPTIPLAPLVPKYATTMMNKPIITKLTVPTTTTIKTVPMLSTPVVNKFTTTSLPITTSTLNLTNKPFIPKTTSSLMTITTQKSPLPTTGTTTTMIINTAPKSYAIPKIALPTATINTVMSVKPVSAPAPIATIVSKAPTNVTMHIGSVPTILSTTTPATKSFSVASTLIPQISQSVMASIMTPPLSPLDTSTGCPTYEPMPIIPSKTTSLESSLFSIDSLSEFVCNNGELIKQDPHTRRALPSALRQLLDHNGRGSIESKPLPPRRKTVRKL